MTLGEVYEQMEFMDVYLQPLRREGDFLDAQTRELRQEAFAPSDVISSGGIVGLAAKVAEAAHAAEYGDFLRSRTAMANKMRRRSVVLQHMERSAMEEHRR